MVEQNVTPGPSSDEEVHEIEQAVDNAALADDEVTIALSPPQLAIVVAVVVVIVVVMVRRRRRRSSAD